MTMLQTLIPLKTKPPLLSTAKRIHEREASGSTAFPEGKRERPDIDLQNVNSECIMETEENLFDQTPEAAITAEMQIIKKLEAAKNKKEKAEILTKIAANKFTKKIIELATKTSRFLLCKECSQTTEWEASTNNIFRCTAEVIADPTNCPTQCKNSVHISKFFFLIYTELDIPIHNPGLHSVVNNLFKNNENTQKSHHSDHDKKLESTLLDLKQNKNDMLIFLLNNPANNNPIVTEFIRLYKDIHSTCDTLVDIQSGLDFVKKGKGVTKSSL
ncbi:hypothetical protein HK096_001975 [Nowakowskiella sp. JEL0078]|nr:hypothetical protein HK096_001975 [Nowakowskiella sp. JEL0078]